MRLNTGIGFFAEYIFVFERKTFLKWKIISSNDRYITQSNGGSITVMNMPQSRHAEWWHSTKAQKRLNINIIPTPMKYKIYNTDGVFSPKMPHKSWSILWENEENNSPHVHFFVLSTKRVNVILTTPLFTISWFILDGRCYYW